MSDKRYSAHHQTNISSSHRTSLDDEKGSKDDDCAVDSGVISGQIYSEEFDSQSDSGLVEVQIEKQIAPEDSLMRLDSGVDVGLTESFSDLNIRNDKRNDLSSEITTDISTKETQHLNIIEDIEGKHSVCEPEPWQLYFQQDDEGDTQLHIAIVHGMFDAVKALLAMCPHPSLLDIRNDAGNAPLHLAVLTQQPHIARRLLIAGAKVITRDAAGNTALHLAAMAGDLHCLRALTTPLAPAPGVRNLPQALDQKNYDGETCVHVAALRGDIAVIKYLVWYGANINATENKSGKTALHVAIERGDIELLKYLITECSSVCVGARTYAGRTAFQLGKELLLSVGYKMTSDDEEDEDYYESEEDTDDDDEDLMSSEIQFGNSNYFNQNLRGGEINVA